MSLTLVATHAPAGEGHRRAAEAVVAAARQIPGITAEVRDCLEGSSPWFAQTYTAGYLKLVRAAPVAWGALYQLTDRWGQSGWLRRLRRWGNARQGRAFADWLVSRQPDIVVATHFFAVEVAVALKRQGRLKSMLICAITDWQPHAFWLCPGVDQYAVASEATRRALLARGIPAARITVTGIPIDQRFADLPDRETIARQLGIEPRRWTILIGSGGFGVGPVETLVRALSALHGPYQLLVLCGHHEGLRRRMELLRASCPHPMTVYDFVHNMYELMTVADLLISKPGGLTCAEAMAKGLPMLIVAPIPGQEARNAAFLIREGAAIPLRHPADAVGHVERLHRPGGLDAMKTAARRLAKPAAAETIVRLAERLAHV